MMSDAINKFADQFAFEPAIVNEKKLKNNYKKYILSGMGGSHLAADLARIYDPALPLIIRSDYGLPQMLAHEHKHSLFIASSYSGNTEEVIDALNQALKEKISCVVIAVGGKLLDLAKKKQLPYVQLPNTGIQPRSALGFSLNALFKIMGREDALNDCYRLAKTLQPQKLKKAGAALAKKLKNKVPIIYCSRHNKAIGYNWKIKLNETGKIPAFYNVFPELNHNEMTGFDIKPDSKHLSKNFYFIFLRDPADHKKIQARMEMTAKLYKNRKLKVEVMELSGKTILEKIFTSLVIADWTAVHIAEQYNLESEQVPMVEELKQLIKT
ncbi:MAG: bifunctional phosphoglucose/phosphomannose isomerase [bacterium]|nr:bifunctional phosphoglucose/phosphomannose isomerase [bacterium]